MFVFLSLYPTQVLLQKHKLNIVESQYYLAPIGAASLLATASISELPRARAAGALGVVLANPLPFVASALLGLAASFMTFLVIKVCIPYDIYTVLSLSLSLCVCVCVSVCLALSLFISLSLSLSVSLHIYFSLSLYIYIYI